MEKESSEPVKSVKSSLLLMANIEQDLNIKQMQLLSYALETLQEGKYVSEFRFRDFLKKFHLKRNNYNKETLVEDLAGLAAVHLKDTNNFILSEYIDSSYYSSLRLIEKVEYDLGFVRIEWRLDEKVKNILGESSSTFQYDLETLSSLGKKGWLLYEVISLLNQRGETEKELNLQELASLFNVQGDKSDDFNYINRRYLEPSINQINNAIGTNFWITKKRIKPSRKIIGVKLLWLYSEQGMNDIKGKPLSEDELKEGKLYQNVSTSAVYRLVAIAEHEKTGEELAVYSSELDHRVLCTPKALFKSGIFTRYYPTEVAEFNFVKVYLESDLIVEGTYEEIVQWVRQNLIKKDVPLHFASAEAELKKFGFRIEKTKHQLSKYYWE